MDAQENTHAEASAASDAPPSTTAPQTPGEAAESRRLAFERHFAAILGAPAVGGATLDAAFAAERALEVVAIARGEAVAEKLALLPDALFPR
ncbi:MAG TPA: hypothetical protein PK095_21945, partial [Myxococcota bacterium]|nr:hypothetical protein [Myxococcota bacterium]